MNDAQRTRLRAHGQRTLERERLFVQCSRDLLRANQELSREVEYRRRLEREHLLAELRLHEAGKLQCVGRLAAGVAEEINTPAQVLGVNLAFLSKAHAQIALLLNLYRSLARRMDGAEAERLARLESDLDIPFLEEELPTVMEDSQTGLGQIMDVLRALSAFAQAGTSQPVPLDLNRYVEDAATLARREWRFVADLQLDLAEDLPLVQGRAAELCQVFLSLILNAARAIEAKHGLSGAGLITVSTRALGTSVEVRVQDNGPGIPAPLAEGIFEPFSSTCPERRGLGLDLAGCRVTVEAQHRGRLTCQSEPGTGATFVVALPATAPQP